jgi:hypothetical protein
MKDYTPLTKADRKQTVPLKPESDIGLKEGKTLKIGLADVKLPADGNDLIISGRDKSGKTWTLTKNYCGLGTSFFTSDLDRNGTTDIVLLQWTGACGIAPPTILTLILFDKNQRPFPLELSGYSQCIPEKVDTSTKVAAIDDLITLGSDKRAVLVCNKLESAQLPNKNGSFWRTQLYRANDGRWERIKKYGTNNVPMIVRYTSKANQKVIPNPVKSLLSFEDGAFGAAEEKLSKTGTITKVIIENEQIKSLKLSPNATLDFSDWPLFHPYVFHDTKNNYELWSWDSELAKKQMMATATKHTKVRYAKTMSEEKPPLYLWLLE